MTNMLNSLVCQLGDLPIEAKSSSVNLECKEKTNLSSLEAFIELVEICSSLPTTTR